MTRGSAAKWALSLAVVGGLAWLVVRSPDQPDVLKALVGCYETTDRPTPIKLQVDGSGWLVARNDRTQVTGYQSKAGDSLWPAKKLVFDRYDQSRVEFDTENPLLIGASPDHQSLTALDDIADRYVVFHRVPCGKL